MGEAEVVSVRHKVGVDLFADLVPGASAAGFVLGQKLSDVKALLDPAPKQWLREEWSLAEAIDTTTDWLEVLSVQLTEGRCGGNILHYGKGAVSLSFGSDGVLYQVFVSKGYVGALFGSIKVGSKLSLVNDRFMLVYDDGDEMHYPQELNAAKGIAFYAEELPLDDSPEQIIDGISVHDWALMRD